MSTSIFGGGREVKGRRGEFVVFAKSHKHLEVIGCFDDQEEAVQVANTFSETNELQSWVISLVAAFESCDEITND